MLQIVCTHYVVFSFRPKNKTCMSSPDFSALPYYPACPSGCVECVSEGQCRVCAENMFVKDGQCSPECGHGYDADRKTRECRGNTAL